MTFTNLELIRRRLGHLAGSILFLLFASSAAGQTIRTAPMEGMAFNSEIDAVEAIGEHCRTDSAREDAEHVGGVLLTANGTYTVTHGQAKPGDASVTFSVLRRPTDRVVALWHTHGAEGRKTEFFSVQDNDTVRDTGLPFYLIAPSGRISLLVSAESGLSGRLIRSIHPERLEEVRSYPGLILYRVTDNRL